MGPEYPKAIYRDGGAALIWGLPVETSAVRSEEEEREALQQGWRLHPVGDDSPDAQALRVEYKQLAGKRAFPGWGEDILREKIAALKGE